MENIIAGKLETGNASKSNNTLTGNTLTNQSKEPPVIQPKRKKNLTRNHSMNFAVTEEERAMIDRRMAQTGITNRRAYLLKMAVDGRVIHVELQSVKEMIRLLSNATNNINQIAKRANETGNIYAADLDEISQRYEEIWGQAKLILRKLAEI